MAERPRVALAIVVVAAIAIGWATHAQFQSIARLRWQPIDNDRNVHYLDALRLALDLRDGDVASLLSHLDRARQWPPLHSVAVATALLLGGRDPRVAVIPNELAWVGTIVLAFLLARASASSHGAAAGVLAATLVAASPAHRAFATDVMLESLGAFLTLLAIWAYVRALRDDASGEWSLLGAALTLLLLEKYNYWLLVVLSIGVAELRRNEEAALRLARHAIRLVSERAFWRARVRDPLVYIVAAGIALAIGVATGGGFDRTLFGIRFSMSRIGDALYPAYLSVLGLLAGRLWRQGGQPLRRLPPNLRQLVWWHGIPLSIFLALPGRLRHLLFFVSPSNTQQEWHGIGSSVATYAGWFEIDYHWLRWEFVCVVALATVGVLSGWGRRARAAPAVTALLVGASLTLLHPNHQSRYLHSWIALAWVTAGVGLAASLDAMSRYAPRWIAFGVGWALIALLAIANAPFVASPGHSQTTGLDALVPSTRDVTDAYLPALAGAARVGFASNAPIGKLVEWSFLERYGDRQAYGGFFYDAPDDSQRAESEFQDWLAADFDRVVTLDLSAESPLRPLDRPPPRSAARIERQAPSFRRVSQQTLERDGVTIAIWQRVR